jgi:ASC-1-like (ASCH) protein
MKHSLKIHQYYLIRLLAGTKTFEIRFNDRDFQSGDTIKFLPLKTIHCDVYEHYESPFPDFKITYTHTGIGLNSGYMILGVEPVSQPAKIYG